MNKCREKTYDQGDKKEKMSEIEKEMVSKMLRAVLQSSKNGVALSRVQAEYKGLTGEVIPFRQLGHPTLESFLKSIPSVVKMDFSRTGEVICFAAVCSETAHIAKLVARQRSSKKKGGGAVNCQMRLKHTTSVMQVGKPKATLRQPEFTGQPGRDGRKPYPTWTKGRGTLPGTRGSSLESIFTTNRSMAPGGGMPRDIPVQRQTSMPSNRSDRKLTLPPRFQKELQVHLSKNSQSDSNGNWHEGTGSRKASVPAAPNSSYLELVQCRLKEILGKYKEGIFVSKLPQIYRDMYGQELKVDVLKHLKDWTHICTLEKLPSGEDFLQNPNKNMQNQVKTNLNQEKPLRGPVGQPTTDDDIKQKVAKLLTKYNTGLWAKALPKVFEDTYKMKLPGHVLNNLDLLSSVCSVVYPSSDNPQNAILYEKTEQRDENLNPASQQCADRDLQTLTKQEYAQISEEFSKSRSVRLAPPPLTIPQEASPSVLVVELNNTNDVVIRYVGKDYSSAQELMEDKMKEYYSQSSAEMSLQSVVVGQLIAARAEEDAWLRAEIVSVEGERVKVCYVDYGFSEMIDKKKLRKLGTQFYSLPFQAAKCRLAGLEAFSEDPAVVKSVESLACGKILLVEILERSDVPLVVLYDTSGEDDVNINATCLKALHDKSLELNLKVDSSHTNVKVTNVGSDGTIYCQIPSKGLTKLTETLEQIDQYFSSRPVTSEYFLSVPFCGKYCLFHYKGKWIRVEITSIHSSRALDVQFLDSGTVASVKVSELREIPPCFLRELISIPPQAVKCCLADLPFRIGMWTPDAVLWLRDTVLNSSDCSIKIIRVEESKGLVHIYLFTPKNFPYPDRSINRQITNEELWKHQKDVYLSASSPPSSFQSKDSNSPAAGSHEGSPKQDLSPVVPKTVVEPSRAPHVPELPPHLPLPKPGEQMDIYVSVACHPGHFVLQPWQELHRLEVLMEEMILHYNTTEERPVPLEKNKIYAAKVDKKWHRVLVKGILTNGLVSLYELDYGRHELVSYEKIQPLIGKFRQLPFQAVTTQLAGVKRGQWPEEASILFRNNVEKKPLVAVVQEVHESPNAWDRKMIAFLVDTSLPDTDLWIHDLMSEYLVEMSAA